MHNIMWFSDWIIYSFHSEVDSPVSIRWLLFVSLWGGLWVVPFQYGDFFWRIIWEPAGEDGEKEVWLRIQAYGEFFFHELKGTS